MTKNCSSNKDGKDALVEEKGISKFKVTPQEREI